MSYCENCGAHLYEDQKFCPGCGSPVSGVTIGAQAVPTEASSAPAPIAPETRSDATLQKLAELRTQSPRVAKSSGSKVLIAIVVMVLLVGIAVIGGVVYLGYRAKQVAGNALN
jgi:uncharacterized membrane protein YvbJ